MYKYDKLKTHLNESPSAYHFGKAKYIGTSIPNLYSYALIWCSEYGATFRKNVRCEKSSATMENNFACLQNNETYEMDKLQSFLSRKEGHYFNIQCGGMSNLHVLVKTDAHETIDDVSWNTLRLLHMIRWVPSTDMEEKSSLGVALHALPTRVVWMNRDEIRTVVDKIPDPDIHWVWFRKPGYFLTQEIIERATSWIALNPASKFHLWTDIPTEADVDDFLKNIKPDWCRRFRNATTIHLQHETNHIMETVLQTLETAETAEGMRLLRAEFASAERQSRVYKTDFFRLFVLWYCGGVYADFNDLLCLGPMKEALAIYDIDQPLGVTDLYDLNHASNYFMYCPAKHDGWLNMMKEMVKHFEFLIRLVRDAELEAAIKEAVLKTLDSCMSPNPVSQPVLALQTLYNRHELPYIGNEHISDQLFERLLYVILGDCLPSPHNKVVDERHEYLRRPKKRRGAAADPVFQTFTAEQIAELRVSIETKFHTSFLFWWVDYNLRVLMHYTNLPIYCRMRKMPLCMLPFGYFFSYLCMLSYVAHIGDGTSYGMDGRKDVYIANYYNPIV